eukprot:2690998-Amphidinium_carterae.1
MFESVLVFANPENNTSTGVFALNFEHAASYGGTLRYDANGPWPSDVDSWTRSSLWVYHLSRKTDAPRDPA